MSNRFQLHSSRNQESILCLLVSVSACMFGFFFFYEMNSSALLVKRVFDGLLQSRLSASLTIGYLLLCTMICCYAPPPLNPPPPHPHPVPPTISGKTPPQANIVSVLLCSELSFGALFLNPTVKLLLATKHSYASMWGWGTTVSTNQTSWVRRPTHRWYIYIWYALASKQPPPTSLPPTQGNPTSLPTP